MSAASCGEKTWRKSFPTFLFGYRWQPWLNVFPTHSVTGRPGDVKRLQQSSTKADLNSSAFFFFNKTTAESCGITCRGDGYLGREPPLKPTGRKSRPQKHESRSCTTETHKKTVWTWRPSSQSCTGGEWRLYFLKRHEIKTLSLTKTLSLSHIYTLLMSENAFY